MLTHHTYLFQYLHNDELWNITIKAQDEEDAKRRLQHLHTTTTRLITAEVTPVCLTPTQRLLHWWNAEIDTNPHTAFITLLTIAGISGILLGSLYYLLRTTL